MSDKHIETTSEEVREEPATVEETKKEEEYYTLPESLSARNRIWSVLSLICAILSVVLCPLYFASFVLSVLAVVFSIVMRRSLGFFNRSSVVGLIIGIMGFVFAACSCVINLTGFFDLLFGK